ncbi:hypothetical protein B0H13DRAFT_2341228 [Mycena leptocephala]|nr:hypothetical protein B0H13DRAFT_2341228 [Mycena leptocephala]
MPALLMLSTLIMGIGEVIVFDGAANATQITFALAAATNLVLAALTGNWLEPDIYSVGVGIGQQVINIIPTFTLVVQSLHSTYPPNFI